MRADLRSKPVRGANRRLKTSLPTWLSSALKGSSRTITSGFAYAALAKAKRAFCPPLRVTPLSPMIVFSRSWSCSKSDQRQHACKTSRKRFSSNGLPNVIFSSTVALIIQGAWGQYATETPGFRYSWPLTNASSPSNAATREDFPPPTGPTIATSWSRWIFTLMFCKTSVDVSLSELSPTAFEAAESIGLSFAVQEKDASRSVIKVSSS
mmetsp:Transcript_16727/g.32515  ORF Transcript_16727/g.32515 Transcript_16727/m.32515 type:complete len:209 (-) Transcript_16727:1900-2526(-)